MPWVQVTFSAARDELVATEAVLEDSGALVVTVLPQGDEIPWEPAPGALPQATQNWISALFPLDFDARALREALSQTLSPTQQASLSTEFVADEDWSRSYQQHAVTECFGERLWLLPKHEAPRPPASIRLDPGLAFGTGSHSTTRLCLEALAQTLEEGSTVLDYGCGSGVLGLAALALGAETVWAIDYDPQALVATAENAVYNGFSVAKAPQHDAQLTVGTPAALTTHLQFDMIVANILANPLIELAPRLSGALRPGGRLLLAGLLSSQADDVRTAYGDLRFVAPETRHREAEWLLLEAHR
ncbi:MAG: 50S ribosomal protein L11 methyltransferase [Pseudomonadota bacterium]